MKIFASVLVRALSGASAFFLYGSYKLGQFDSALMTMHELIAAETSFARARTERGYTCDLPELLKNSRSEGATQLTASGQRSGYLFEIRGCMNRFDGEPNVVYEIIARPHRGGGNLCADRSGRVSFYDAKCDQK